jgi:hypothetical protein
VESLRFIIYSFVGSIVNLCNCCYLDSTRIMCVLRRAHYAWWCISKATSCRLWRDRYNLQGADFGALHTTTVLIHTAGNSAAATSCCYGGGNSTSEVEAMSQSGHGSSKPTLHKVMHSPWRVSGPWMQLVIGRGLLSCWPLLLGGDTSRTPARGGRGA